MQFRAATALGIVDATNTIELWDGDNLAATVNATRSGIHIMCAPGYEPDRHAMAVQVQRPFGVVVGLCRDDRDE